MKTIFQIACCVVILSCCSAQVVRHGDCPQIETVNNFVASRYVGKWYEIERYPFVFEAYGECVTAEYRAVSNTTIEVINRQINSLSGMRQSIRGMATFNGPTNEAKLSVSFDNMPLGIKGSYWVVDTDYDNYAVVWSCTRLGFTHLMTSWVLARQREPSNETLAAAYQAIDRNRIDRCLYEHTKQKHCPDD